MKNFDKVKALERIYGELSKQELNPQWSAQPFQVTIQIQNTDISFVLDVLSQAIHEERGR